MADIKQYVKAAEEKMTFAIEYLDEQLSHIVPERRIRKFWIVWESCITGAPVPLNKCGYRNCSGCKNDHDHSLGEEDYKGYWKRNYGFRSRYHSWKQWWSDSLGIPPLTEERRRLLAKQSKQEAETAKISIRNARRDAIEQLKKSIKTDGTPEDVEKDAEAEVQKVHDKYIKESRWTLRRKEKEIMTV